MAEINRLETDIQDEIINNTHKQLIIDDINFTGGLSKSVHAEIDKDGRKAVIVDSPYSIPVEFGMPAGTKVNFDALRIWVEGKLGIDPSMSKQVTSRIWHKIMNEGINATRFFKKAIKMTIADHGILSLGVTRQKKTRYQKILNKLSKSYKKSIKTMKKLNKVKNRYKGIMRNVR